MPEVLGPATELPFSVFPEEYVSEDKRLAYRFLDLRRQHMHHNVIMRSKIVSSIRRKLADLGFTEFQTPILTNSSPAGARDFLVPSRLHPGKFFALPQAPQQFKQLLMVAGFDRYFQIAPCFRDEDSRADRSPGEFYQLDLEMSFVEQEDIFAVVEELLSELFTEFAPQRQAPTPFPRITYRDALALYGTDKPDLRVPFQLVDLSSLFTESTFRAFSGKCVLAFMIPEDQDPLDVLAWQYDIVCNGIELSSGAIRNHRPDIMYRAFEIAGYSEQDVQQKFGGMLRALSLGAPPHGGIAPGIDRIVMLILGEPIFARQSRSHSTRTHRI